MTQQYELAQAYITSLTGHLDTVMDWRAINDTNAGVAAHTFRGTLRDNWQKLVDYNNGGWGIFCCINAMDGQGLHLNNVHHIRTHIVDLDNMLTAQDSYNRAIAAHPQPHFAVQTSPGKYHLYWLVEPYTGNDFYNMQQRKLRQLYDGDKSVIDPTRVLRVPGFYHLKAQPHLVTCWQLHGGARWPVAMLADSMAHVSVFDHVGVRSPLGTPELAAPSIEWLRAALNLMNPNDLDRSEWNSITAAFKQAGWTLADEQTLLGIWKDWCAHYDPPDNDATLMKMWNSLRDTEVGWAAFERRTAIKAHIMEYGLKNKPPVLTPPMPKNEKSEDEFGDILDASDQARYFKDCYFIGSMGEIFNTSGRYMNSVKFNAIYGGKQFTINNVGKTTNEAWTACTKSTIWKIPVVDHIRFLPDKPPMQIVKDELGRKGLNTYLPVKVESYAGDVSRWMDHFKLMLPVESDRIIWFEYMAHCIKYPGYKIAWAPMFQSVEGTGKSSIYEIMNYALGQMYVYKPSAKELVASGSKFNSWMECKMCIVVDEIKIDERRELIEVLKPMITDARIEMQAKGQDQEMKDNVANWIFFSNYKDAIPLNKNGRRYSVFYSPIQTKHQKEMLGWDKKYFGSLYRWMKDEGGLQALTHWFLNYPIEKGDIPHEAPESSSHFEALRVSRSPMEIVIEESIADQLQGFRGGYVSSIALTKRMVATGIKAPSSHSIRTLLESLGYWELGRAEKPYMQESILDRTIVYVCNGTATLEGFAVAQGYV